MKKTEQKKANEMRKFMNGKQKSAAIVSGLALVTGGIFALSMYATNDAQADKKQAVEAPHVAYDIDVKKEETQTPEVRKTLNGTNVMVHGFGLDDAFNDETTMPDGKVNLKGQVEIEAAKQGTYAVTYELLWQDEDGKVHSLGQSYTQEKSLTMLEQNRVEGQPYIHASETVSFHGVKAEDARGKSLFVGVTIRDDEKKDAKGVRTYDTNFAVKVLNPSVQGEVVFQRTNDDSTLTDGKELAVVKDVPVYIDEAEMASSDKPAEVTYHYSKEDIKSSASEILRSTAIEAGYTESTSKADVKAKEKQEAKTNETKAIHRTNKIGLTEEGFLYDHVQVSGVSKGDEVTIASVAINPHTKQPLKQNGQYLMGHTSFKMKSNDKAEHVQDSALVLMNWTKDAPSDTLYKRSEGDKLKAVDKLVFNEDAKPTELSKQATKPMDWVVVRTMIVNGKVVGEMKSKFKDDDLMMFVKQVDMTALEKLYNVHGKDSEAAVKNGEVALKDAKLDKTDAKEEREK